MRFKLIAIFISLLLIVFVASSVKGVVELQHQSRPVIAAPRRAVTVAKVAYQSLQRQVSADGSAFAWELIAISPETGGLRIDEVPVREGQHVKRGQRLVKMNDSILSAEIKEAAAGCIQATNMVTEAEAKVRSAKARYSNAESNANRYKILASNGAVSVMDAQNSYTEATSLLAEFDKAVNDVSASRAALLGAQARLERLQALLKETTLSSPEDGLIVKSDAKRGEMAAVGKPLFFLARDSRLELRVKVPEIQLTSIHPGQKAIVRSRLTSTELFCGRVRELVPSVDEASRLGTVRIDIPYNRDVIPGMFFHVDICIANERILTLPREAVIDAEGGSYVFVIDHDRAIKKSVTTGNYSQHGHIEVASGLSAGQTVVLSGAVFLKDGETIAVVAP